MKKMLWIGSFMTDDIAAQLREIGYKNAASILSQHNILQGMEAVTGCHFDSVNAVSMEGFPGQPLHIPTIRFSHTEGAEDILVGYLNIRYINKVFSAANLKKAAAKWAKTYHGETLDVFIYEMRSACLTAAKEVKKHIPSAKIHLIVPDLPAYMDLSMNPVKKVLKNMDRKKINRLLPYVEDYILYTAPMADYLSLKENKWMLMEGSINQKDIKNYTASCANDGGEPTVQDKVTVMYSGGIKKGFGIQNLLESFQYLDDSFELWITGSGDAKDLVTKYAATDKRIRYYGYLPTRQDLQKLQQRATMLVNMRLPEEPASTYCFPSKLFEYMLTGKPVLSCRLGGIPDEYFEYLVEMKNADPKTIALAIQNVASMSENERSEMGRKNVEFISKAKNNIEQAKKIMDFIHRNPES